MYSGKKIVILTGAGISAESGLGTFRDKGGLWESFRIEDVATPEAFARDPKRVHDFYNLRRAAAFDAAPNAAHDALARLEAEHDAEVVIVTQNVDDLHARAGSRNILQMHGKLAGAICHECGATWDAPRVMSPEAPCPACNKPATRPDIVWFGEMPHFLDEIAEHLASAEVFVAIGTSGQVYPAAAFVGEAASHGAYTIEMSLEPTATSGYFEDVRKGPATQLVPDWVAEVLKG